MKLAYLDCFAGVSGNMFLAALLDAGLEEEALKEELEKLGLSGYRLRIEKVQRMGITGTHVNVETEESGIQRHLFDILEIIEASGLAPEVKKDSARVFKRLAEVEANIHGKTIEEVHFHEIGALDSIIDIVGTVAGLWLLGVEQVFSSPIHLGTGFVHCAHGRIPVPAPATSALLRDAPVYSKGVQAELCTPTGAALISTLSMGFGPLPDMTLKAQGYGAGSRELEIPNLFRIFLGKADEPVVGGLEHEESVLIETNIDDMNPEFFGYLTERLFALGAQDVYTAPIQMKKNRPATLLSVLVQRELLDPALELIFLETSSFGVRLREITRLKLKRKLIQVETPYGKIGLKLGYYRGAVVTASPEYEDCRAAAREHGVPLQDVYGMAREAGGRQLEKA